MALITVTPSLPTPTSPARPSSGLYRILRLLPLLMIALLQLTFSFVFLISLNYNYLLQGKHSTIIILYTIPFILLTTLSILSLGITWLRGPGIVANHHIIPPQFNDSDEDDVPLLHLRQHTRKANGQVRFCKKCNVVKPDRAHHDSVTNTCILKFDHYCPIISTPIGHNNYKPFLLFILYTALEALFAAIVTAVELRRFVNDDGNYGKFELAPVTWAAEVLFGFIMGISLMGFGIFHLTLVGRNRTTIESLERPPMLQSQPRAPSQNRRVLTRWEIKEVRRKMGKINIYDLGWRRNFEAVFGSGGGGRRRRGWWSYAMPVGVPIGDGYGYEVDLDALDAYEELQLQLQ